ncbi:hypothetical protein JRG19_02630 [Pseudoclavibacter alba]|uniref:hypothetical protein n=1 Tax=Pseudoclavibacter albus TaxID=272241 RepID=UPI0019D12FC1|nr:hypothetical protein [Pseudoclavibacter alba]MBN6777446.1 hypothetical protein [Pseudoclavibacter alba]
MDDVELIALAQAPAQEAGKHAGEPEPTGVHGPAAAAPVDLSKVEVAVDDMIAHLETEAVQAQASLDADANRARMKAALWAGVRTAAQSAASVLAVAVVPSTITAWGDLVSVWQAVLFAVLAAAAVGLVAGLVAFLQWIGGAPVSAVRATLAADRAERGAIPVEESARIHQRIMGVAEAHDAG